MTPSHAQAAALQVDHYCQQCALPTWPEDLDNGVCPDCRVSAEVRAIMSYPILGGAGAVASSVSLRDPDYLPPLSPVKIELAWAAAITFCFLVWGCAIWAVAYAINHGF